MNSATYIISMHPTKVRCILLLPAAPCCSLWLCGPSPHQPIYIYKKPINILWPLASSSPLMGWCAAHFPEGPVLGEEEIGKKEMRNTGLRTKEEGDAYI